MKTLESVSLPATAPAPKTSPSALGSKPRQDWVDNLRTLMIVLVVNVHACVTYSFVGSWYYNSAPEPSIQMKIPFFEWEGHLQSFFMGLLFFIGGYYADRSLARRGVKGYAGERVRRLGIPALLFMVMIHPLIVLVMHPGYPASGHPLQDYLRYLISGRFVGGSGPMWFAFTLLIFSLLFVAVDRLGTGRGLNSGAWRLGSLPAKAGNEPALRRTFDLRAAHIFGFGILVGLASFLVRIVQPIGTSILNLQFCFFAQYVTVFALGIWASRRDVLADLAMSRLAKRAGILALILGPIAVIGIFRMSLPIPATGPVPFMGGWNVSALACALWEQIAGVSLGLGCMWFCANKLNKRTPISAWLSDRSFGVYFLHPPILVALAVLMQPYRTNAYVMSIVLTVLGLALSYGVADMARRIPGVRAIL